MYVAAQTFHAVGMWGIPHRTDCDVTFSRSCDQGKITKKLER